MFYNQSFANFLLMCALTLFACTDFKLYVWGLIENCQYPPTPTPPVVDLGWNHHSFSIRDSDTFLSMVFKPSTRAQKCSEIFQLESENAEQILWNSWACSKFLCSVRVAAHQVGVRHSVRCAAGQVSAAARDTDWHRLRWAAHRPNWNLEWTLQTSKERYEFL